MPLSPEQLATMDEPPVGTPNDPLSTRSGKLLAYITAVNAATGTGSMRARNLAQRLAGELGYIDPMQVKPAVAIEPALVEIEKAVDGAHGDAWG